MHTIFCNNLILVYSVMGFVKLKWNILTLSEVGCSYKKSCMLWTIQNNDLHFLRFYIRNELVLAKWGTLITKLTVNIILPERHLECLFLSDCMHVTTREPIICSHEIILLNVWEFYKVMFSHFNFNPNQTIVRRHALKESQILFLFAHFASGLQRICQNYKWFEQMIQRSTRNTSCAPYVFLVHGFGMINMLKSREAIHHCIIR
jgi:hypothetical protein